MSKKPFRKPQPPKRLAPAAAAPSEPDMLDEFLPAQDTEQMLGVARTARVSTLLAMAMLQDAVRPADLKRMAKPDGLAVVVSVPGPDWVEPVTHAVRKLGAWCEVIKRNGSSRQEKPENGCGDVAEALGAGNGVVGVSHAPERYLPANLVALADIRIDLKTPSPRALRSTIRLATGSRPGPIPAGIASGLSFATLAGCIRRGTSGRACVRRIEAASRALIVVDPGVADVPPIEQCHGYDEGGAKAWALGLVAAMQEYRSGLRPWSSIEDRNIVLSGDPGVGKSTFARSVAKSLRLPLFSTSVSSWFASTGGYLNEIIRQVDTVIGQASAAGHAVLLLEEIDSIPNRSTVDQRNREYWVALTSHILTALDSAMSGATSSLIIIGATNFPERLDEALVRPGRLNRIVRIERPDTVATAGILRQHLMGDLRDVDLGPVAAIGAGATGAEIAGWAKRARGAARAAGRPMTRADLVAQVAPPDTRDADEILGVARHEASHCVIGLVTGSSEVETVSTVPNGPYAGLTRSRVRRRSNVSRRDLDDFVVTLLAGRAADALWGSVHSGSAGQPGSDLAAATRLVAAAHASYGLGGSLAWLGDEDEAMRLARTDEVFRRRIEADLSALQARADRLVRENAATIDAVAARLVRSRVLSGDEVRHIVADCIPASGGALPKEARDA
ncbi:AAA family ATPase [Methylobacterium sp. 1030]|uniref:AAA family ATPase n=1 Tax=Methylobacterium sp. 1030 TaxID=3156404 RepID=UPI003398295C